MRDLCRPDVLLEELRSTGILSADTPEDTGPAVPLDSHNAQQPTGEGGTVTLGDARATVPLSDLLGDASDSSSDGDGAREQAGDPRMQFQQARVGKFAIDSEDEGDQEDSSSEDEPALPSLPSGGSKDAVSTPPSASSSDSGSADEVSDDNSAGGSVASWTDGKDVDLTDLYDLAPPAASKERRGYGGDAGSGGDGRAATYAVRQAEDRFEVCAATCSLGIANVCATVSCCGAPLSHQIMVSS